MNNNILLVEDNQNDILLTKHAFEVNHIINQIDVVENGLDALTYLSNKPLPFLVLLDLNLPFLDGISLLEKIRSNEKTKTLPVIILTSSRSEIDLIRSYCHGCNSYIVKPVNFNQLQDAIKQLGLHWMLLKKEA